MERPTDQYPARIEIDYPESLDRLTTFLRIPFIIPIVIIQALIPVAPIVAVSLAAEGIIDGDASGGFVGAAFFLPLILMILFRRKYPRWWFDFLLELTRFQFRISAYFDLLTDKYPSTDEEQDVHLELDYPDAAQLHPVLPIVKWILLIPHYIAMVFLLIGWVFALILAWFAILIRGRYPPLLFDYVVGVNRWILRISAYGFLLITDRYPPFSLKP